jgi:DNA-binding protein inhibitor ID
MKAITAVCATGASVPAVANGRVSRPQINRHHNNSLRDTNSGENAEIQMYLSKLKDLVPFMPKNKKLSKLDVILNVIDYICDLQSALESHPAVNTFDAQTVLNGIQQQQQQQQQQQHHSQQHQLQIPQNQIHLNNNNNIRQPLGVRSSPNQILNHNNNLNSQQQYSISNNSNNHLSSHHQHHYNHHESYVNHNSEYSTHQSHVVSVDCR